MYDHGQCRNIKIATVPVLNNTRQVVVVVNDQITELECSGIDMASMVPQICNF